MQRAVVGKPAKFRISLEDEAGTKVAPDAHLTVTVKDRDGATLSTGVTASVSTGREVYAYTPAALDVLTVAWTGTVSGAAYAGTEVVRVIDRRPAALSWLKTDEELKDLDSWDFLSAVDGAEDALETALRYRIVTTVDRVPLQTTRMQRVIRLEGNVHFIQAILAATRTYGLSLTVLDTSLIRVILDGLELPTTGSWGFLTGEGSTAIWFPGIYSFDVKHGLKETPADIVRALRVLARHLARLGPNAYPDRASKIMSAETEIWFARGGTESSWFGIPEVDSVVATRRLDIPFADNTAF